MALNPSKTAQPERDPESISSALQPGVAKREVFAWAMYDFANSGYTTVVLTAVYAAYFVGGIAQGATWATFAWTLTLSISYALVMLTMPMIGARADAKGNKLAWLKLTTLGCVLSTLLLYFPQPGQVWLAAILIIVSNLFYSYGESLAAAFLPELAKPESLGRVSGWGWAWGYFGGMLALGLCLAYVMWASAQNIAASDFVPVTMVITAALYGLPAIFTFVFLKERASQAASPDKATEHFGFKANWQQLRKTYREVAHYPDFGRFMLCTVCYHAGVAVAITIAAIYAEQVIGFQQQETMILIFALNLAAAAGAFAFGYVQDKLGHKGALALTLVMWIATCVVAAWSSTKGQFWIAATLAGLSMGSSQSAGRALTGLLSPEAQRAEFFALWTVAVRLASIIGPLSYGIITWATAGEHRIAIAATSLFFVAALLILKTIHIERGRQLASPPPR